MKFTKVRDVKSPTRGTSMSAGLDFYVPNDVETYGEKAIHLPPGDSILIPSGIHVNIPKGYALIAMNKSGVATRKGLVVGACVIDEDYQGEVHLHVINSSRTISLIEPGEKLVQMLLVPVSYVLPTEVESLSDLYSSETERGSGGFGSTGTK